MKIETSFIPKNAANNGLANPRESKAARLRRSALYVLECVPGRPGILAPLNRTYRPLGNAEGPGGVTSLGEDSYVSTGEVDLRFAWKSGPGYYFFKDGSSPWLSKALEQMHQRRCDLVLRRATPTATELLTLARPWSAP
jgi:hypothetical protein